MKSRSLYVAFIAAAAVVACKTGGGSAASGSSGNAGGLTMDPGQKVAEVDGKPVTWADVQNDKDEGQRVKQAEMKAQNDLYEARRGAVENLINHRLLEDKAKASGKPVEQWLQTDFMGSVPDPSDAQVKAFYDEHKAQIDQQTGGAPYDAIKDQLKNISKRQNAREQLTKMLDDLKKQHGVSIAMDAPRVQVEAKGPSKGPSGAKVTVVEFSDFQCPFCSRVVPTVHKLMDEYKDQVRLVYRNFPLDIHPMAEKAAEAGACAADQGKFWEMHDKMFSNQQKLEPDALKGYAKEIGLDTGKFDKCLDSGEKKALVDEDQKAGSQAGVNGTPAFFVNGVFLNGAVPYEQLKATVDRELGKKG